MADPRRGAAGYPWDRALLPRPAQGANLDQALEALDLAEHRRRKTHVVARSGLEDIGKWLTEERDLYADYAERIGGPMPTRIVRVWLICVTVFQQTEGKCQFADIAVQTENGTVPVL